jgi:hypothetical protein
MLRLSLAAHRFRKKRRPRHIAVHLHGNAQFITIGGSIFDITKTTSTPVQTVAMDPVPASTRISATFMHKRFAVGGQAMNTFLPNQGQRHWRATTTTLAMVQKS